MNGSTHAILLNVQAMKRTIAQDDEIVTSAQAGSPAAFSELHAIYSKRLYKTIIAITRSREDAEDALQETFLRAYRAIHTFEGRSSIYSWLTRIGINSALMVRRKRPARPEISLDSQPDALAQTVSFDIKDSALDPEQLYVLRQRRVEVLRAARHLDARLRGPIRMRIAKGASIKEIAQALNISEAAVKARLHRARLRLAAACVGSLETRGGPVASSSCSSLTTKEGNWNSCSAIR